jgi:hypothetical protein
MRYTREMRNTYKILVQTIAKPELKRPFGRRRHRWLDNFKMIIKLGVRTWTGVMWFRIGFSDGLL